VLGGGTSQADVRGHTVSAEAALLGPVEGVTLEPIGRERARHDRRASATIKRFPFPLLRDPMPVAGSY
jgi:hypothetical protein